MSEPRHRKICWPGPDAVCLQGGCGYCNLSGKWMPIIDIHRYAERAGLLQSFRYGQATRWGNAEWSE